MTLTKTSHEREDERSSVCETVQNESSKAWAGGLCVVLSRWGMRGMLHKLGKPQFLFT